MGRWGEELIMLVNTVDNMEDRLKDEFDYLSKKYPNVAFNHIDWNGKVREGKDWLFALEGYITIPQNYDPNVINKYKGLITHNRKFAEAHPELNIVLTNGYANFHNYYRLDNHKSYEERIDGVCSLHNIYTYARNSEGEIVHKRPEFIKMVPSDIKHTYGPVPWGNDYKGKISGADHPNHIENLKVINNYKFVLSLESTYHPMWSYDWITCRLFNAIKAKTIPIYYGCFNIEEHVPSEFYIDFRKYVNNDIKGLKKEMDSYTKQKFEDQTEKALEWYEKKCDWGKTPDIENVLAGLK